PLRVRGAADQRDRPALTRQIPAGGSAPGAASHCPKSIAAGVDFLLWWASAGTGRRRLEHAGRSDDEHLGTSARRRDRAAEDRITRARATDGRGQGRPGAEHASDEYVGLVSASAAAQFPALP